MGNDAQFQRMCQALELESLRTDPRFATNPQRLGARTELLDKLGARLEALGTAEVIRQLENFGVPVGPIEDLTQVLHDPEVRRRRMVLPIHRDGAEDVEVVNGPWKVDGHASAVRRQPPRLGEHTEEVMAELRSAGGGTA